MECTYICSACNRRTTNALDDDDDDEEEEEEEDKEEDDAEDRKQKLEKHADPYESVDADGEYLALVNNDLLDASLVTLLLVASRDLHLTQAAVPQQHVSPLGAGNHLPARQLPVPVDVRYLLLAELAQVTLQLQPGERLRHLPEPGSEKRPLTRRTEWET